MNCQKILLIFCFILLNTISLNAAEKKKKASDQKIVKKERKSRYCVQHGFTTTSKHNEAGPAQEYIEMEALNDKQGDGQPLLASSAGRHDDMEDEWPEEVDLRKSKDRSKKSKESFPAFFIRSDGECYEIPQFQFQQYLRGEIDWKDLVDWMVVIKAGYMEQ
jgi:hypothetical protein